MTVLRIVESEVQQPRPLSANVRVGKDILGLLSTAMYADPLSIVREYVQNAADSIDLAYEAGLLSAREPGRIDVIADDKGRTLVVRDNGTGIAAARSEDVLVAFGLSAKRGTGARGFRGVGRLGGLGFAQYVAFRTRFSGESKVTEIAWDCRALRAILLDSQERSELSDVVRRIVTVRRTADARAPEHFFEVALSGVVRLRKDRLLNPQALADYLGQVAPVPLSPDLRFSEEINTFLQEYLPRRRVDIRVNASEPLVRPHRTHFVVSGSKKDRFVEHKLLKLPGVEGGVAAVGWILHHSYTGALKASPDIRGLRARVGDIQIGDEELFANAFAEPRFNGWVVGELHVLGPGIVPNGRRDGFEATAAYSDLVSQLSPICRDLAKRCRSSSLERARMRTFEAHESQVAWLSTQIRKRRVTGRRARAAFLEGIEAVAQMEQVLPRCSTKKSELKDFSSRVKTSQLMLARSKGAAENTPDPLQSLTPAKRAAFEDFIRGVNACASSKKSAEILVSRLMRWIVRSTARANRS